MKVEPLSDIGLEQALHRLGKPYMAAEPAGCTAEMFSGIVPDLLLDVWRAVGFSGYADGLFWLCDPDEWQPAVDDWISGVELPFRDEWTPFARTAFGRITLWGKNTGRSLTIVPQDGFIIPVDQSLNMVDDLDVAIQLLVALRSDNEMLDEEGDDNKPLFRRLNKRLGGLNSSTMYGCVPAVGLGGSFTPRGMAVVNAVDHVRFLSTVTQRQVMNWAI
ncbi:GAD-like domain-containing protein [Nocardia fluminea]|uniref:GAD-like domain-containing protein n=1 Tax=Nocardia fluminea TaxID=134984 RepID=UPI00341BDCBD